MFRHSVLFKKINARKLKLIYTNNYWSSFTPSKPIEACKSNDFYNLRLCFLFNFLKTQNYLSKDISTVTV
jgi:hypothetical protein